MIINDEDLTAAQTLLAIHHPTLTGREMEVCERIATRTGKLPEDRAITGEDLANHRSLQIQLAREIAAWKEGA